MNTRLNEKISDLNEWVVHTFEDSYPADILNSARKSAEALCKAAILKKFGEDLGGDIIDSIRKKNGVRTGKADPKELSLEQLIINVTNGDGPTVISSKSARSQVFADLKLIQSRGNIGSHDFDISKIKIKSSTIQQVRLTLCSLVEWFYTVYLKEAIPASIEEYINESTQVNLTDKGISDIQDSRGCEIVKLAHPRRKIKLALPDYTAQGIGYEFVAIEVAKNNVIGHLFIKSNISPKRTIEHFLNEVFKSLEFSLSTLQVCTPRVINPETRKEKKRKDFLERNFKDLAFADEGLDNSLLDILVVDYIDDFVWDNCLYHSSENEYSLEQIYGRNGSDYFLDQELFLVKENGENQTSSLSLKYLEEILGSMETINPVTAIVGQAGIGKTTFCDQAIKLITEKYPRKKALLISSEDFQGVVPRAKVRSISGLYELVSSKLHSENADEILESNNLEINISCGNIVLIIDGIDEIESILGLQFDLHSFLESAVSLNKAYKRCLIIITSRDYYLERYLKISSINTFRLLGFSEPSVEDYLSNKRELTTTQIRKVRKYLREFEANRDSRHIPLYLSLICDLFDGEEVSEEIIDYEIEESHYFYGAIPLDCLMYKIIRRELVRQKIDAEITCDLYVDILGVTLASSGEVEKKAFDDKIYSVFPGGLTETEHISRRNPFYVSPLLIASRNGKKFKLKYDFLNMWLLCRLFLCRYGKYQDEKQTLDIDLVKSLSDFYDGSSLFFEEILELQKKSRFCDISSGKNILEKLLHEYIFPAAGTDINLYRRAISGLLYFCFVQVSSTTSSEYTQVLIDLFGGDKIYNICVFGKFFPLDFRDIEIHDGWIENYGNCKKSKFPEKAVFYNTTIKKTSLPPNLKYVDGLFVDCSVDKEIESAIDISKASVGELQKKVREDLTKIFKVAFKRQSFRWKSEYIYKEETSFHNDDLQKYLSILVKKGVFIRTPNKYSGPDGYEVTSNYRDSVKDLVLSGNLKPQMSLVVKEVMAELYGI